MNLKVFLMFLLHIYNGLYIFRYLAKNLPLLTSVIHLNIFGHQNLRVRLQYYQRQSIRNLQDFLLRLGL